jgi:hypothetical protein
MTQARRDAGYVEDVARAQLETIGDQIYDRIKTRTCLAAMSDE